MEIQQYKKTNGIISVSEALKSETVRNSNDDELREILANVIGRAFQDSGQVLLQNDSDYLVSSMPSEIRKFHPNIRLDEIAIAFERGVRGEYGKYFGLNVISFTRFLKCYMESDERRKEMQNLNKKALPEKTEPNLEELAIVENEIIINAFQQYCDKGFYDDHGNHIYNKLDQRGFITFTAERKNKFMSEAKSRLISRNNVVNSKNLGERKEFQTQLQAILDGTEDSKADIIREAKRIALSAFFSEHKDLETDFKQMIEEGPILEAF